MAYLGKCPECKKVLSQYALSEHACELACTTDDYSALSFTTEDVLLGLEDDYGDEAYP